jgi:hypothetical protein
MKSKFAPTVVGYDRNRIYKNNTYIMDASYADRFGQDRFLLMKKVITYESYVMENIIVEGNYFDAYILSFIQSEIHYTKSYTFKNNVVKTKTCENVTDSQAFGYIKATVDGNGNPVARTLTITGNAITADSKPSGSAVGSKHSHLFATYETVANDLDDDLTTIVITGNTVTWYFTDTDYTSKTSAEIETAEITKYTQYRTGGNIDISGNTIMALP